MFRIVNLKRFQLKPLSSKLCCWWCDGTVSNCRQLSSNQHQQDGRSFLQNFSDCIQEIEQCLGFDTNTIRANINKSIPEFAQLVSSGKNQMFQMDHLKYRQSDYNELVTSSLSPFLLSPNYNANFQQDDSKENSSNCDLLLSNLLGNNSDSVDKTLQRTTFDSIRPDETFWILTVATLINTGLSASFDRLDYNLLFGGRNTDPPLKQYIFLLLNIVQLIRDGSRSRLVTEEFVSSVDNCLTEATYKNRLQLLKGNFFLYNFTYNLMKLNIANITELMSGSLRDITHVHYWMEKQCTEMFSDSSTLKLNDLFVHQLADGSLISKWNMMVSMREASLLGNGCQSMAYLLGKEPESHQYRDVQRLGNNLAYIQSLVEDYFHLKFYYRTIVQSKRNYRQTMFKHWTSDDYLCFMLRLPVLLYFKEKYSAKGSLDKCQQDYNCQTLIIEVCVDLSN